MARSIGIIATIAVVAAGIGAIAVHDQVTSLEVEAVSDDVYVIFGLGGNVAVLKTATGAVVVDTMSFRIQGERIRELAEKIAGGPGDDDPVRTGSHPVRTGSSSPGPHPAY